MIQFAIIIPFTPKAESVNWVSECDLLKQTIESVLHQTYAIFKVFVVYTDYPDTVINDKRVEYIRFPYGYQTYEEITNKEVLFEKFKRSAKMVVRRWDKGRKLTYASKLAKEEGYDYVMALDADDLLSKRVLAYLEQDAALHQRKGWYIEKGYLFKEHTNYLVRVPKDMRFLNGSSNILHASLIKIPDFSSTEWEDYNLFTDHGWVKGRMQQDYGVEMVAVPFAALVYVIHSSNISQVMKKEYGFNLKGILKRILRRVQLTAEIKEEFSIRR